MPYLNLDLDYFTHPKILRLTHLLGHHAAVYPLKLWCYVGKHFPVTGMLEGCSKHEIERAVGWDGEAGQLVDVLVKISLLDVKKSETETENYSFKIHDWKQHAGHLWAFKKRAKTAAKKRWKDYASSIATSNAKGCAPNLSYPNLLSSLHLQKDSEKKEKHIVPPRGETVNGSLWKCAEEVIGFLNERTGKHFQSRHPNGDPTKALMLVHSLLKKGYTPINLRQVVANRCLKWRDDQKMEEFLRPETLFRASNFTNYLGELGKGVKPDAMP